MKKGYLYLVVSDEELNGVIHFHEVGILVECTDTRRIGSHSAHFENGEGLGQYMQPDHVFEIGEI